jgi:crossover junction endodeoxyribonuclease RuvC
MLTGKNKSTIIIGVDPGIADTGYGIIKEENGKLFVLEYGSIKTSAKAILPERLCALRKKLSALVEKYQPSIAVVEQLFFCTNVKTALTVGQARGVILVSLADQGLKIIELTPLQVKQGLTGYGKADKRQMQQMVKAVLNLKEIPKPDDAADALAMAVCGATMKKYC